MSIERKLLVSALVLATSTIFGCGGEPGVECGEGTVARDGRCVSESPECGVGTRMTADGRCVTDGSACAPGSSLEVESGRCVPDAVCGTGTVAMGGACVPDGSVVCAGGTVFDPESGTCVVTDGSCGEGLLLVDGECIREEDALSPDVLANEEPDEPMYGGTPATFSMPGVGEERTLGGRIVPADKDGDGSIDADSDWFDFTVAEAGLYRIRADGFDGVSAAFAVVPRGETLDARWLRIGMNLASTSAERQVFIPSAGDYSLVVFDGRSLDLPTLNGGLGGLDQGAAFTGALRQPASNDASFYHVTIEGRARPAPTDIALGQRPGVLGAPQFFRASTGGAPAVFINTLTEQSSAAIAAHVTLSADVVRPGIDLSFSALAETEEVVVDFIYNLALDAVPYELEVRLTDGVPEDGEATITHREGRFSFLTFGAERDDVVRLEFNSDEPLVVLLVGPTLRVIHDLCGGAPCDEAAHHYLIERSGTHSLAIFDPSDELDEGDTYTIAFERSAQTPPSVSVGADLALPLVGLRTFARFDASAVPWLRARVAALTDVDEVVLGLSSPTYGRIPFAWDRFEFLEESEEITQILGPDGNADLLVEILNLAAPLDPATEEATLRFDAVEHDLLDARSDMAVTRMGDVIAGDEERYYLVRALSGGEVTFTAEAASGPEPTLVELDETGASIGAPASEPATLVTEVSGAGWVAFAVSAGADGGSVDITLEFVDPPYLMSAGTSTFASVCPRVGAGEVVADGDDVLTPVLPIAPFEGFSYFGETITGIRVDTNGLITFDEAFDGLLDDNDDFDPGEAPFAVIAPFWDDLISEVCMLRQADRLVVEWNGRLWRSAAQRVRFQAILSDTGTIEFVFGPGHNAPSDLARMGLKSPDGATVIEHGAGASAGDAILFTPSS